LIEIERKYLVKNLEFKSFSKEVKTITQGYINDDPNKSVRIRLIENNAYITIKGKPLNDGLSRYEWEKKISLDEGLDLLKLCKDQLISKKRYYINFKEFIIEVDEFLDKNKGLYIAEIELNSLNQKLRLPTWIGEEVTGINKYYNLNLISRPFTKW
jgi:CYTH domain-containing protein